MTSEDLWDKYIHSYIIDDHENIWSGPNAISLPIKPPIHIITAYNPNSHAYPSALNIHGNQLLAKQLVNLNICYTSVIGCSPNKEWCEASFAVNGLNRNAACQLAKEFHQRAIFELTDDELLVVCVNTNTVKKRRSRIFD